MQGGTKDKVRFVPGHGAVRLSELAAGAAHQGADHSNVRPSRQYISIHIVLGCAADRLGKVHESLTRRFRSHAGMTERVHGPDETLGGICHPSDLRRSCSGTLSHRSVQRGGRREALRLGRVRSLLLQFRSPGRTNYYRHEARDCPAVRSRMRPRAPSVAYSYLSLVPYLKRAEDM